MAVAYLRKCACITQTIRVSILISVHTEQYMEHSVHMIYSMNYISRSHVIGLWHLPSTHIKAKNGDHEFAYQKYISNSL